VVAPFWSTSVGLGKAHGARPTFAEAHGRVINDISTNTGKYVTLPDPTATSHPDGWLWWPNAFELDRKPRPLLVLLAGRGDTPQSMKATTHPVMLAIQDDLDAFVLGLTGRTSSAGANSWNFSQEGCWPPADGPGPDDDAYIAAQIQNVIDRGFPVDTSRIGMWGRSCGGGMTFRYACNHPDQITAVVQLALFGIRTDIDAPCAAGHTDFLIIHGTSDTILYNNSTNATLSPNTVEYVSTEVDRTSPTRTSTITQAALQNGCSGALTLVQANGLDFDSLVPGPETDLLEWSSCPSDGSVTLWRSNGSAHVPGITSAGYTAMLDWLRVRLMYTEP
jgi:poly(3-hydroxybutyrate) depolymerase